VSAPLHPGPAELLDLRLGELSGTRRARVERHLVDCPECAREAAALEEIESALAAAPELEPPADGLARVMAEIDGSRAALAAPAGWERAAAASLCGMAAATGAIYAAGSWLLRSPLVERLPWSGALGTASGFGLAALGFFALGSFVTLAIAPVLLMEARQRPRPALAPR